MERMEKVVFFDDSEDEVFLTRMLFQQQSIDLEIIHITGLDEFETRFQPLPDTLKRSLVVVDLNMPRIHGSEVVRNLRADERFADIVIGICTGSDDPADARSACEAGADFFVAKPLEKTALARICQQVHSLRMEGDQILKLN